MQKPYDPEQVFTSQKDTIFYNKRCVEDRTISELIGIARGIIADGAVNEQEAAFLCQWLESNRAYADKFPINILYERIQTMLQDDAIDADERMELLELLHDITGGTYTNDNVNSLSSTLPLTQCPCIEFAGKTFCFTGTFGYGIRKNCEKATMEKGATIAKGIIKKLDYLVIGIAATKDWKHSTFGRKIEKALEYNKDGAGIHIVSEDAWVKELNIKAI